MTARRERPLSLAFLGDPNSIHTRRWLTFFVDRGHRVNLLVPNGQAVDEDLDARIQVDHFTAYPSTRIRGLGSFTTRRSIRRALREVRPEILHAHSLARYGWMADLSGFRPLVITVWGTDVLKAGSTTWWARRRSGRALAAASLVTAVSRPLADAAVHLGARADRVTIIQFGVDPELFLPGPPDEALRRRLDLVGRRVVFAPRALRPLYRQGVVVEALAELPEDVVVVFGEGGQDVGERARLEARAIELGVADRLRFGPAIPHAEMPRYYRLADTVVSVPESDAFPVTALEAMATGVPLVLSDLPSARDGLAGIDPGALVPVGDGPATAEAILTRLELTVAARAALAGRLRAAAIERGDTRTNLLRMETEYLRLRARR